MTRKIHKSARVWPLGINARLQAIARIRGIEIEGLEGQTGIDLARLRRYFKDGSKVEPSLFDGLALAQALNVAPDWLCCEQATGTPPPYLHSPRDGGDAPALAYWPPNGLAWEEVDLAIRRYIQQRAEGFVKQCQAELEAAKQAS